MADNTLLNSGVGGDTIASDDILGIKHQRVKVEFGAPDTATEVSEANPLPVTNAAGAFGIDEYYKHTPIIASGAPQKSFSLFNPAASGRKLTLLNLHQVTDGLLVLADSFQWDVVRITAHSGGTLISGAAIGKKLTSSPNSVGEIRHGAPITTTDVADASGGNLARSGAHSASNTKIALELPMMTVGHFFPHGIVLLEGEGIRIEWINAPGPGICAVYQFTELDV